MCLAVFDFTEIRAGRIRILSNRDEFYERPTEPLQKWSDPPMLGGRDLSAGGAWLGVTTGAFGLVTNYRDPSRARGAKSRGDLLPMFLRSSLGAREFAETIRAVAVDYGPFNLVLARGGEAIAYSNVSDSVVVLEPRIYGLSNHLIDSPWPKVLRAKREYERAGALGASDAAIWAVLRDETRAIDAELPSSGVSLDWERRLSPIFIASDTYGTRASSLVDLDGARVRFLERRFGPGGAALGESLEEI